MYVVCFQLIRELISHQIKDGHNIFSHAIPPTTSFEAAPVSLRWRTGDSASRLVCYATKDQALEVCSVLSEEHDNGPHTLNRLTLQRSREAIVHMDFVGTDHPAQVLIVQVDGTVTLASANMEASASLQLHNRNMAHSTNLIAAVCLSGAEARQTTFKARPDLASELLDDEIVISAITLQKPSSGANMANRPFYCTWAVSRSTVSTSPTARLLMEHDLTSVLHQNPLFNEGLSAIFGPRPTMLSVKMKASFTTLDLGGISPRSLTTIRSDGDADQSALNLSSSHIILADRKSLQVLDSTYLTTQAALDLPRAFNRKRKRDTPVGVLPNLRLVSFFRKTNRVLASSNHHVIAFDLKHSSGEGPRLDSPPSLAQSLGRGRLVSETLRDSHTETGPSQDLLECDASDQTREWLQKVQDLDQLLKESKNTEFMKLLLLQLEARIESKSSPLPKTPLASTEASASIRGSIVEYALSKIFMLHPSRNSSDEFGQLSLMQPRGPQRRKIIEILSASGSLSASNLTRAHWNLQMSSASVMLQSDSIAQALSKDDPSVLDLMVYTRYNTSCNISEQAATVKLLVVRLLSREKEAQSSITAGREEEEPKVLNEDNAFELTVDNSDSINIRIMRCLTIALDKLAGAHSALLSKTFKNTFSEQEVFVLIQILRQSLFQGGHSATSPAKHREDGKKGSKDKKHTESLKLPSIVASLSACLDVVGPLGVFTEADQGLSASIVPDLLSEISLASEAIEEAVNLQGVLREVLRYTTTIQSGNLSEEQDIQGQDEDQSRPGDIITLYTEPDARDQYDGDAQSLPLSLRAKSQIAPIKFRKGGGQAIQRRQREMKMLRDRERSSYSYERLIL